MDLAASTVTVASDDGTEYTFSIVARETDIRHRGFLASISAMEAGDDVIVGHERGAAVPVTIDIVR